MLQCVCEWLSIASRAYVHAIVHVQTVSLECVLHEQTTRFNSLSSCFLGCLGGCCLFFLFHHRRVAARWEWYREYCTIGFYLVWNRIRSIVERGCWYNGTLCDCGWTSTHYAPSYKCYEMNLLAEPWFKMVLSTCSVRGLHANIALNIYLSLHRRNVNNNNTFAAIQISIFSH